MNNSNENIRDKNQNSNNNSKSEALHFSNYHNRKFENTNKQLEEETLKNSNFSSPKNNNFNNPSINHHNKNFSHSNDLAFKETKFDKFQGVNKLTRKKIAPIDGKNPYMNKTNKNNDFMKYINKTLYQDTNKKLNEDNLNIQTNQPNNEKISTIKSLSDLKNHLELFNLNTPTNMKKTLNSLSIKNNNKSNNTNINNSNYQNNYSTFSNAFSPTNPKINHFHTQSLNENTFKNFINSTTNHGGNFPFPIVSSGINVNNNNLYNANPQNQTTKFLFDVSNFQKFNKAESAKFATKPAGIISSFGVNTNFGNVRY